MIRGKVISIKDPEGRGRIKISIPSVDSFERWAEPCFLPACIVLPEVGDVVWIDFEDGNISRPVWLGCLYTKAIVKAMHPSSDLSVISFKPTRDVELGNVEAKNVTAQNLDATEVEVNDVKVALVGGEVALNVPASVGTIKAR